VSVVVCILLLSVPPLILWQQRERAKARGLANSYPIWRQARAGFVFVLGGTVLLVRSLWRLLCS
jgi:hypothetical protein